MTPERLSDADDATLAALTDLCLRSKAHWGYDAAFMAACRDVLTVTREDLQQPLAVVRDGPAIVGMVAVTLQPGTAELSKLFVSPGHIGHGIGSALIHWAKAQAHAAGHPHLRVESDPEAEAFYLRHGAVRIGQAPSEAIPGRMLPLLSLPTAAAPTVP